jgi:hypothetical protein
METPDYSKMTIAQIGMESYQDMKDTGFRSKTQFNHCVPYLEALYSMQSINDKYGADSGSSIVAYFLSNARQWKGEVARNIKKELNKRLKER